GLEKLSLLLLRPIVKERLTDEAIAHGRNHPGAGIAARKFLDRNRITHGVESRAAVLLRDEDAQEPESTHLLGPCVREFLAFVEGGRSRDDLLLCEIADRLARDLLDLREREIHASRRRGSSRIKSTRREPWRLANPPPRAWRYACG